MSLWWLQPGWAEARCGQCGGHIQQSGGDPDWGLCWPFMQHSTESKEAERAYYAEQEREYYAALVCEECEPWFDGCAFVGAPVVATDRKGSR